MALEEKLREYIKENNIHAKVAQAMDSSRLNTLMEIVEWAYMDGYIKSTMDQLALVTQATNTQEQSNG